MSENSVIFQAFEWHIENDGNLYKELKNKAKNLKDNGIDALWLPPVFKGTGQNDVGYGIYDLYDLGEFDQKGTVRTKYGTLEELRELIEELHNHDMKVYIDIVLNHKAAADFTEEFEAVQVDEEDRTKEITDPQTIEGWTGFNFPGREGKYSDFEWNYHHFSGIDYDQKTGTKGVFKIIGEDKYWSNGVSNEKGNYDYLMFADIDHNHPEVREELFTWSEWLTKHIQIDGMRLDALKHIDGEFMQEFIKHVEEHTDHEMYFFGEYWIYDTEEKNKYLYETKYHTDLFDVALHYNMVEASMNEEYDIRQIFDNTLVNEHPMIAVTFVDNHDSQPGQSLESFVEPWFKKIAYGLILLRKDGYPCVFYGDYYGIGGEEPIDGHKEMINQLLDIRKTYAYGEQETYMENENLMGWVRFGNDEHPGALATVVSTGDMATLPMYVGENQAGKIYVELTGENDKEIVINEEGYGDFEVGPGTMTCWVEKTE